MFIDVVSVPGFAQIQMLVPSVFVLIQAVDSLFYVFTIAVPPFGFLSLRRR